MFKSLAICACFALCVAACSSAPLRRANPPQAATPAAMIGCVPDTATRLPPSKAGCTSFGHSYSSEDLQRTGKVYPDQALGMLDPSVTGSRH
jgi:hypothetical protein